MIVPPQAVMLLTAHVGDSVRCWNWIKFKIERKRKMEKKISLEKMFREIGINRVDIDLLLISYIITCDEK